MSAQTSCNSSVVKIEVDASELSPQQVRLVKTLNTMLAAIMVTESEEEYFEGSAELLRMCASIIKQAKFNEFSKGTNTIPYAQQALEYAVDILQEHMTASKVVSYDN